MVTKIHAYIVSRFISKYVSRDFFREKLFCLGYSKITRYYVVFRSRYALTHTYLFQDLKRETEIVKLMLANLVYDYGSKKSRKN